LTNSFEPALWTAATFLGWFLVSYCYYGLGITLGYHRLLTHKSLKVPRWLMYVIVSGGYFCLMGSPIVWVGVHRLHHQKSDMPGDPHTPVDGFWHALVGWMFTMEQVQPKEDLHRAAGELMQDKFFVFLGTDHTARQAQLCLGINIAARLVILYFFGWVALAANVLALGMVFWATQFVNTFCHMENHGYRLFDTREGSRNVWWVAILSMGEGWHNNHHAMPRSARHGMAWWEFDATWISVWILEKLGLATEVVRPAPERLPWNNKAPKHAAVTASASPAPMMSVEVAPHVVQSNTPQSAASAAKS
jgi:stearoyl-CoA desaturase (delta-9 desaturase)